MKKTLKLLGAGISTLTLAATPVFSVLADGPEIVIKETNWSGGFEISQINEAKNTVTGMFTGATDAYFPEYQVLRYHFFWGDVEDEKLPEMVEGTQEGITTFAKGTDGETQFPRAHMQVDFPGVDGAKLTDNAEKIISYAVYLKSTVDGVSDKIVAGRYDYSGCVNSIGYSDTDTEVFCTRSEYYGGKSYYTARKDWQALEPLPKIEYVERTVEVPTVVEKIVEKIEYVTKEVPIEVAKEVVRTEYLAQATEAAAEVLPGVTSATVSEASEVLEMATSDATTEETVSTDTVATSDGVAASSEEDVEVPELGGNAKSSKLGWILGLTGLAAIGGLGLLFWFVLPLISPRRRREKTEEKRK